MNDYDRIASIIRYLDERRLEQPDLATLAARVGLGPHHFHRLFSRWAGITPKDFLQCLTFSRAKELLREGESVLETALEAGLSGPGRLHDLCVSLEAASPGEIKSRGADWTIRVGFSDSPFGPCLVGESPRGICHFSFVESMDRKTGALEIHEDWPRASIDWDDSIASRLTASVFAPPSGAKIRPGLRALVRGSDFQVRVWRALLHIPRGSVVSYGGLAAALGNRGAARAVGAALGKNPLGYLIPCHRVIRETGVVGEYRWGRTRKKALLVWERSREPQNKKKAP